MTKMWSPGYRIGTGGGGRSMKVNKRTEQMGDRYGTVGLKAWQKTG
jgi:hypothetical protein